MIAFALVLLAGVAAALLAAKGARSRAAAYFRLACTLYGAMALAYGLAALPLSISLLSTATADAVADIVLSLGAAVLSLGSFAGFVKSPRILSASLILAAAALSGIASAMLGQPVLAAVPQVIGALFVLWLAAKPVLQSRRSGFYLAASSASLIGAASCHLATEFSLGTAGLMLFAATALCGAALASNIFVEEERRLHGRPSVD